MRLFFAKICLAAGGTLVGLLLATTIPWFWRAWHHRPVQVTHYGELREKLDRNPEAMFKFDPDISYLLKPNFVGYQYCWPGGPFRNIELRTNSRGLLGAAEISPDPQVRKVLFLGDSVTHGVTVSHESNFVSLIQREAGDTFQLANGSCSGWSTRQEIGYYEKYLSDVDWDAVVLVFCLNDLVDYEWVYDNDAGFKMSPDTYASFDNVTLNNLRRSFKERPHTNPLARHHHVYLYAWTRSKWDAYYLKTLRPAFEKHGDIPLIVVAIPTKYQIEALRLDRSDRLTTLFPQRQLEKYCQSHKVSFVDCSDCLVNAADEPASFYMDACHLTESGHILIANCLWPRLLPRLASSETPRERPMGG